MKKIERELKRLGWSKYRLAQEMKVRHQHVYFLLSDSSNISTLHTITRIADALGVEPKDLIV